MENVRINDSQTSTYLSQLILIADVENGILKAKLEELHQWQTQKVYTEVDDCDQETMSVTWVVRPKTIDGTPSVKARLCARGLKRNNTSGLTVQLFHVKVIDYY